MPRIKLRRTTHAAILLDDPTPLAGEAVIVTDAQEILIGDGVSPMSQLVPWGGPGVYAAAGHTHSDLIAADSAASEALANHAAQFIHEITRTERIYVPLTPVGGTLDDDAVIYFPWPASGHLRAIKALARVAPTGSAVQLTLKMADTWGGALSAVASPVAIAVGAHSGIQDTISSPDVLADGLGAVEITADSGATAADVALLIDLEHAIINRVPPPPTGEIRTVAWNFPAVDESTIDRFEVVREGDSAVVATVSDVTARTAQLWMDYDQRYSVRACLGGTCSTLSGVIVAFAPGLARGKPTTASSEETYQGTLYAASHATDGRSASFWASLFTDSEWLRVDLGAVKPIQGYRLLFTDPSITARDWIFESSDDGTTWTTLDAVADNTSTVVQVDGLSGSGRYVRWSFSDRADGWEYGYQVREAEVL